MCVFSFKGQILPNTAPGTVQVCHLRHFFQTVFSNRGHGNHLFLMGCVLRRFNRRSRSACKGGVKLQVLTFHMTLPVKPPCAGSDHKSTLKDKKVGIHLLWCGCSESCCVLPVVLFVILCLLCLQYHGPTLSCSTDLPIEPPWKKATNYLKAPHHNV